MKILLVGTGAREHAIATSLLKDDVELYTVMSNRNPALAKLSKEFLLSKETEAEKIRDFAIKKGVEAAVVGPEAPLAAGVADALESAGVGVAGPKKALARIEWDKGFCRYLMKKYKISGSPDFGVFEDEKEANEYIDSAGGIVVKPLGLTGGKGVKVLGEQLESKEDAKKYAAETIKKDGKVLIEEKLEGEECTIQAFTDGKRLIAMPLVQDHKRAYENDEGPNTGGMGSYSDANHLLPFMNRSDYNKCIKIMKKTLHAMKKETGEFYKGILYGGVMLTRDGPFMLEYNSRFGDPEAMNVLPLLETSFVDVADGIISQKLRRADFSRKATVCKYAVPKGYPTNPAVGAKLTIEKVEDAMLFYASVNEVEGEIRTTSSRSIAVLGIGDTLEEAEVKAEKALRSIKGEIHARHDIGTKPLIQKRIEHMTKLRAK